MWVVNFLSGSVGAGGIKDVGGSVRAVRSSPLAGP